MCLMALDKAEAVPVDTHVWRIAQQRYGAVLGGRSLTPRAHQEIGEGPALMRDPPRTGTMPSALVLTLSLQETSSASCGAPVLAGRRR